MIARNSRQTLGLAVYGKGGSGKSTIAASISSCLADRGLSVMHMGCDPKADSCRLLMDGQMVPPVMQTLVNTRLADATSFLRKSAKGIACIEAGGPEPGIGCAGRGITRTFEVLEELGISPESFDVVVYDVLGDVVCGGFATPMKDARAAKVLVVTSSNPMSLFAANNIMKAVRRFSRNGIRLAGIVANDLAPAGSNERIRRFASLVSAEVLVHLPFDPAIPRAEQEGKTIYDYEPDGKTANLVRKLVIRILEGDTGVIPTPMEPEAFRKFLEETKSYA
ncbi:MAG: hypothetical protein D6806_10615 [Deltaproteobacteria bacterium]|nr:MAG: hypothetical protein D6806_10615 [Deltaproteobacteria bacterium]